MRVYTEANWYQGSYLVLSGRRQLKLSGDCQLKLYSGRLLKLSDGRQLKLSGGGQLKLSDGRQITLSGGNLYLYYLYILICALQYVLMLTMYMPCKTQEFAVNPANSFHLLHV